MWKNIVETDRPQVTVWRMRIAYWIPKATNTHSKMPARARLNVTLYVQYMVCPVKYYICQCCYLHRH
jgi:hypothetical protein